MNMNDTAVRSYSRHRTAMRSSRRSIMRIRHFTPLPMMLSLSTTTYAIQCTVTAA